MIKRLRAENIFKNFAVKDKQVEQNYATELMNLICSRKYDEFPSPSNVENF